MNGGKFWNPGGPGDDRGEPRAEPGRLPTRGGVLFPSNDPNGPDQSKLEVSMSGPKGSREFKDAESIVP